MKQSPQQTAFAILRITMGINLLGHGLVRLPKLGAFSDWMVTTFQDSILPSFSVMIWSSVLPFVEFGIGLLLILGLWTYRASIAGALVIAMLILGSCSIEKWEWVGFQMIYALFFYFIISNVSQNVFAVDKLIKNESNNH